MNTPFTTDPIVCLIPGGIEASERIGRSRMLASTRLPVDCKPEDRATMEKWGFVFGEVCKDDPVFQNVTLPEGWTKGPHPGCDNGYWSDIFDTDGRQRVAIFFKAAFYDYSANMYVCRRFSASCHYPDDDKTRTGYVTDGGKEIVTLTPIEVGSRKSWDVSGEAEKQAVAWLDANRPGWRELDWDWKEPE